MRRALVLLLALPAAASAAPGDSVTLSVRPVIVRSPERVTLVGTVSSGRAGEPVKLEAKACNQASYAPWSVVRTREGGVWQVTTSVGANTSFRASWHGRSSGSSTVLVRPQVVLAQGLPGEFRALASLPSKQASFVLFQRYDSRRAAWVTVKRVALTGGTASFRSALPKGTLTRLELPLEQTRPCYLAGYSNLMRV
jgi:hypothetical protein